MSPHWITAPGFALVAAATAVVLGWLATVIARGVALRFGIISAPNPIVPQHSRPIAYLGGVGLAMGVAALLGPVLVSVRLSPAVAHGVRVVALPAVAFLAVGLADDLFTLSASRKLAAQLVAALVAVAAGLQAPVGGVTVINSAVTIAWVVLVVNAFNVTDVCDGLMAGIALTGLAAMAVGDPHLRLVSAVFAGATFGFLMLNRPPASIFLGDAGSHLLGYVIAALGLAHLQQHRSPAAAGFGILMAAVPLFEVGLLVVARRRRGLPVWRGSPDHFALRLQARNRTRWQTDTLAWTAAAGASGLGLALEYLPSAEDAAGMVAVTVVALMAGHALLAPDRAAAG